MTDRKASGQYVVFADGFAGAVKEPGAAAFRPSGLAAGPDGALYIADDSHGRIWRVTYHGGANAHVAAAPAVELPASSSVPGVPPEGLHPDAGRQTASLTPPPGATREQVGTGRSDLSRRGSKRNLWRMPRIEWQRQPGGGRFDQRRMALERRKRCRNCANHHSGAWPLRSTPVASCRRFGGTPLQPAQLQAVTTYVYAISRHKTH